MKHHLRKNNIDNINDDRSYYQKYNTKGKKYDAIINDNKKVSFGATGYSDFTKHKDEERKDRYIARHKVNQDWKDYNTAGFWAKNLFWNRPTIEASVRDANRKFLI